MKRLILICSITTYIVGSDETPDYYAILGVSSSASQTDIRRSYLAWAKKVHPDKQWTNAHRSFTDIKAAYDILYDEEKRTAYDYGLRTARTSDCFAETSCIWLYDFVYNLYALYRK